MTEPKDHETDPTSLGNVARMFEGEVTAVHVRKALKYQAANPETKIGDAMVETGVISEEQKQELLKKQEQMRSGKLNKNDVMKMVDYATHKTHTASEKLASFLKSLSLK